MAWRCSCCESEKYRRGVDLFGEESQVLEMDAEDGMLSDAYGRGMPGVSVGVRGMAVPGVYLINFVAFIRVRGVEGS